MTLANGLMANLYLAMQAGGDGTFWMPPQDSTVAKGVDAAFYFIFWICMFFFVGIIAVMIVMVIKYRARDGQKRKKAPHHNLALEITWSVIPLILVIAIFWANFKTFISLETPPLGAYEVTVTAQKWQWLFTYPNGYVTEELHVPAGEPIKLILNSQDVIHSFFVPDFRIKKDVVPGRFNKVWFEALEPGEHWILCAEYCGTSHSDMIARLIVHDKAGFQDWLSHADDKYMVMPPSDAGEQMFARYGCAQCHTVDGKAGTGPTLLDSFNTQRTLLDGTTVLMDEDYIRESLLDPEAMVVAGYQPVMPTFQGKIKEEQIAWIIAYIKTCSVKTPQAELDAATAMPEPPAEDEVPDDTVTEDTPAAPDDGPQTAAGEQGE